MNFKKILKITGFTFLGILLILIAIPFLFEGKIKDALKEALNENVHAQVDFTDVNLSFIRSFPDASLTITNLKVINFEPFAGDTLLAAQNIYLNLSLMDIIKGGKVSVHNFELEKAFINIKIDSLDRANYDIAKKSDTQTQSGKETAEKPSDFSMSLDAYKITDSRIYYLDDKAKIFLKLDQFNHEGTGDLTADNTVLSTHTQTNISYEMGGTRYFNNTKTTLQADLDLDMKNQKYTFKQNELRINQLPLNFDGYVQLLDQGQQIDITFKTPSSSFKNFLAIIPEAYAKDIENVDTQGDFVVNGSIKGLSTDERIPNLDIYVSSEKASFKYPDLPKSVEDIYIKMAIKNETGITNDTYIQMDTLCFRIDQDLFRANGRFSNLIENPMIKSHIDGQIDLSKIAQAYPLTLDTPLQGIVKANLKSEFDMGSLEKEQYQQVKASGNFSIDNFIYKSEDFKSPFEIKTASLVFNTSKVQLNKLEAKTGQTDMSATGTLDNLFGYLFSDQVLKGSFELSSNQFATADFMDDENNTTDTPSDSEADQKGTKGEGASKVEESPFMIPKKIDAVFNVKAQTVLYDNLTLRNVTGKAYIKDQTVRFEQVTSNLFGGKLAFNGNVSTQTNVPKFEMNLGVNEFDIEQSFQGLSLFQNLTPLAAALQGKFNTTIDLKGALNSDMSVNLQSLTGDLLANLLGAKFKPDSNSNPLVAGLTSNLNFLDLTKLNLNDLKAQLEFKDGVVEVKPLTLMYQDIAINVSGTHGFDQNMSYNATFNVPAKYLGSGASSLLANLSGQDAQNVTVPITANIGGSFSNPIIKTDMQSAIQNLSQQLVNNQKQKLINQGTGALGGILGGNQKQADTLKKDSTATKKPVEEAAKSLLNNIFGSKKKKDTVN
ncbi:MAG: AsmA-like C-terminal region-containing protein [Bacteroidetes bacterium]|nr:AsmA-like C-terminal region-containing protein [Bacteroidota bacterium]